MIITWWINFTLCPKLRMGICDMPEYGKHIGGRKITNIQPSPLRASSHQIKHNVFTCRVHHEKCQAGWSTSWNQDFGEKYQKPQICRWQHPYGRNWRTKEPLDESERGEWKSCLKAQHSENWDHGIHSHHFMTNRWGNSGNSGRLFLGKGGAPKSLQMVIAAMKLKDTCSLEEKLWPT